MHKEDDAIALGLPNIPLEEAVAEGVTDAVTELVMDGVTVGAIEGLLVLDAHGVGMVDSFHVVSAVFEGCTP